MSKKSCPIYVPSITNTPKNITQVSPPVTFILLHGIELATVFNIKSK